MAQVEIAAPPQYGDFADAEELIKGVQASRSALLDKAQYLAVNAEETAALDISALSEERGEDIHSAVVRGTDREGLYLVMVITDGDGTLKVCEPYNDAAASQGDVSSEGGDDAAEQAQAEAEAAAAAEAEAAAAAEAEAEAQAQAEAQAEAEAQAAAAAEAEAAAEAAAAEAEAAAAAEVEQAPADEAPAAEAAPEEQADEAKPEGKKRGK